MLNLMLNTATLNSAACMFTFRILECFDYVSKCVREKVLGNMSIVCSTTTNISTLHRQLCNFLKKANDILIIKPCIIIVSRETVIF